MAKPVLYLMLGYPGSGKTTTAKALHQLTGAVHLWADQIRRDRFGTPTYTHQENLKLYSHLNEMAGELLATGQSVIFDTNFNFYKDRQRLREVAATHGADTLIIWVIAAKDLARKRATEAEDVHFQDTRILGNMPEETFERMSGHLQPPREDETFIKVDGTKVNPDYIRSLIS